MKKSVRMCCLGRATNLLTERGGAACPQCFSVTRRGPKGPCSRPRLPRPRSRQQRPHRSGADPWWQVTRRATGLGTGPSCSLGRGLVCGGGCGSDPDFWARFCFTSTCTNWAFWLLFLQRCDLFIWTSATLWDQFSKPSVNPPAVTSFSRRLVNCL